MQIVASYAVGSGGRAYNDGQYQDAYNVLKLAADFDIDDLYVGTTQYYMGLLYFYGHAVKQDKDIAERYFKKASERKNEDAIEYFKKKAQGIPIR